MSELCLIISFEKEGNILGAAERRDALMQVLARRKHDKISNLAFEFGVSERTIRRDIEILSLTEPIRTEAGRYGGVFVLDSYYKSKKYLSAIQEATVQKLINYAQNEPLNLLSDEEVKSLKDILIDFTKPSNKRK